MSSAAMQRVFEGMLHGTNGMDPSLMEAFNEKRCDGETLSSVMKNFVKTSQTLSKTTNCQIHSAAFSGTTIGYLLAKKEHAKVINILHTHLHTLTKS